MVESIYIKVRAPNSLLSRLAVLDLIDFTDLGWWISRINVPDGFRQRGYGNELLKRAIAKSVAEGKDLYLFPVAYGLMDNEMLVAWYERNGFTWKALERFNENVMWRPHHLGIGEK